MTCTISIRRITFLQIQATNGSNLYDAEQVVLAALEDYSGMFEQESAR